MLSRVFTQLQELSNFGGRLILLKTTPNSLCLDGEKKNLGSKQKSRLEAQKSGSSSFGKISKEFKILHALNLLYFAFQKFGLKIMLY